MQFAESREGDSAVVPSLAQRDDDERKTRTQVAGAVGMKRSTFAKVEGVYNIAEGKKEAPEPVRKEARRQMEALDAGATTPHAAEREVRRAQERETVRQFPTPAPMLDPFADHPRVRSARLVKLATRAVEACANNLTYFPPEEMAG